MGNITLIKNYIKIKLVVLVILFSFPLLLIVCGSQETQFLSTNIETSEVYMELKCGGLYAYKNDAGKYVITKILALDDFAVHARFYNEEFTDLSETLSSDDLTFLIGHAPIAREGFMKDGKILITVEKVSEKELEGYRLYLDAMRGQ